MMSIAAIEHKARRRLVAAIEMNDTVTAFSLISSGLLKLNGNPWPLHIAARLGRLEIMALLLDAGANIDFCDNSRFTACHLAIYGCQFDALKFLVERGARLNGHGNRRSLLVHASLHHQNDQILIFLLDAGASLDDLMQFDVMNLVRSVAVFERLLSRGVNFDAMRDESGCTLCHHVALNVADENDFRFLVDVCGAQGVDAVNNRGETPIRWAANAHNIAAMRVLAELGVNVDQQDNYGQIAVLMHFFSNQSQRGPFSCLELLLALGANVRLVNNEGKTAFDLALPHKSEFALVMAAGGGVVDFDRPNDDGESLRMIAVRKRVELPTADEIDAARQRIAKIRLDLVRRRAAEICIGLQQLRLNALQLCEIMMHSFGAIGSVIAFHQWWAIATKVKHFHNRKEHRS